MLCGGPAIHLFSATELERLVCGNPLLDFDAMQANARYDGGYSPEHRVSQSCALHEMIICMTFCQQQAFFWCWLRESCGFKCGIDKLLQCFAYALCTLLMRCNS